MSENEDRFSVDEMRNISRLSTIPSDAPKPELPFPEAEYRTRFLRLKELMEKEKIDLLYVTAPDSMCYLHGYAARWYRGHSTSAWPPMAGTAIHIDKDDPIHFDSIGELILLERTSVIKDKRYYFDERLEQGLSFIMEELKAEGWLGGTVGMEFWSHVPNRAVSEGIEAAFIASGCKEVIDATGPIRAVRRVKSAKEIAYIEEAARICDIGHQAVIDTLRPGVTELDVYGETVRAMAEAGGEISAIVSAISSGPHLAGHGLNSRRVIEEGDLIFYDPCGVYNRYHANLARGYFVGEPPPELLKLYRLSAGSYEVLKRTAKAGASIPEVCRELRKYYEDVGIWELRGWVGGYELGISFPPDWVGEFVWTVEDETEGLFLENEVTNYESILSTILIDTFVYEKNGVRRLSNIAPELIVIN